MSHFSKKKFLFYLFLARREQERSRMEEYERELQEMKDRINRRPLLFEQETQVSGPLIYQSTNHVKTGLYNDT